jgi:hypothetical protein
LPLKHWVVAAAVLVGCTNNPPPDPPEPAPEKTDQAPTPQGNYLDRGQLEVVLREGPPWLLERVPIEEVMENNKFVGWRVQDLPNEWRSIDLLPGDVVVSVNAMPIETPNDFWTAWTSLSVASELKVAYLRDGEPRELSIPIYGQPSPDLAKHLQGPKTEGQPQESPVKANQEYAPPKQKKTITIKGDDRPETDTITDWSNEP